VLPQLAFFHGIFKANTDAAYKLSNAGISMVEKTGTALGDIAKSTVPQGTQLAMGFVFLAVFSAGKVDDFAAPVKIERMAPEPRRSGRMLLSVEEEAMEMHFGDVPAMPSLGIAHATAMAAALAVVAYVLIWTFKAYLLWRGKGVLDDECKARRGETEEEHAKMPVDRRKKMVGGEEAGEKRSVPESSGLPGMSATPQPLAARTPS